jgi:hypothetical protein
MKSLTKSKTTIGKTTFRSTGKKIAMSGKTIKIKKCNWNNLEMVRNWLFLVDVWDVTPLGLLNNDLHYKKPDLDGNKSYIVENDQRAWITLLKAYRNSIGVLLPDAVSLSLPPFYKHRYNENSDILRRKGTFV